MDSEIIPSLEDLAFETSYKDIISNLILCYDHRPRGKRLFWLRFSSIIQASNLDLTSDTIRGLVRRRLDHHLIGTMSEKIREKCVKRFYESILNEEEENTINIWVFLDCILDSHFQELEIFSSFPDSDPSSNLISTIAKWSPQLKKLVISFYKIKNEGEDEEVFMLESFIKSLSVLEHLTHLSLMEMHPSLDRNIALGLIGKACPLLSHLSVNGGEMDKDDIFALILGESCYKLKSGFQGNKDPPWYEDRVVEHLVFPPEFLSPTCSALRELCLIKESGYYLDREKEHRHFISGSTAVLILRHFPLLQSMDKRIPTSLGVMILYEKSYLESQEDIQLICQEAIKQLLKNSSTQELAPSRDLCSTFNGYLSLTKLDHVHVKCSKMLDAIAALCPSLKEVSFCSEFYCGEFAAKNPPSTVNRCELVSPAKVESIVNRWPKLTTIRFENVSANYVKAILKVFHSELKHLEFKNCPQINLADLAICSKLESLDILLASSLDLKEKEVVDTDGFLPNLKSFRSDICLGLHRSRLFEEKATLVSLDLHCCHVGIKAGKDENQQPKKRFKGDNQLERCRISEPWAGLETLAIRQFTGHSMTMMMAELIPQLRKLKEVILPRRIISRDVALFQSIKNEILGRTPPTKISFETLNYLAKCPVVVEQLDGQ